MVQRRSFLDFLPHLDMTRQTERLHARLASERHMTGRTVLRQLVMRTHTAPRDLCAGDIVQRIGGPVKQSGFARLT